MITSKSNENVKRMRLLGKDASFRKETGEFLCEGDHLFTEAIKSGQTITRVFYTRKYFPDGIDLACADEVSDELIAYCSTTVTPQGIVFSVKKPEFSIPAPGGRYLILDSVSDPGNVGTVLRCSDAFPITSVLLTGSCADPFSPKVVRSTMGAIFRVNLFTFDRKDAAEIFRSLNVPVYTAVLDGEDMRKTDLSRCGIVIGNEANGVGSDIRELCKGLKIPMSGKAESLNAGVAAGIFAWEMSRNIR